MKYALMIGLGLMTLATPELSAGILGDYNVRGKEGAYTFKGTLSLTSFSTCIIDLGYSDGDSITVEGKLTPLLKENKKKQTAKIRWSAYGASGSGTMTLTRTSGGYSTSFSYSGGGVSGRGNGKKRP